MQNSGCDFINLVGRNRCLGATTNFGELHPGMSVMSGCDLSILVSETQDVGVIADFF